jgi:hypothetical protein
VLRYDGCFLLNGLISGLRSTTIARTYAHTTQYAVLTLKGIQKIDDFIKIAFVKVASTLLHIVPGNFNIHFRKQANNGAIVSVMNVVYLA